MTITIAATFTAESVEESIAYWMTHLGIPATIRFTPYDQLFQQLHDAESLVSKNRDGINVYFVRIEDWWRLAGERAETVERNLHDLADALNENSRRYTTTHLVCLCPDSPEARSGSRYADLSRQLEQTLVAALAGANGVNIVSSSELIAGYPVADYYDSAANELGHVPYTPAFFTALGTTVARKIYALKSAPKKVIVLDCDQTLWKGVCGEDGPAGITVDLPRRALQEFMVGQHDAGMVLCLCSKNNEQDVWDAFRCQADMPLKRDHLVSWRINWRPKSENLKALAAELKLGLDSFIFVDDNPTECAEVEAACPEVLTIRLPFDANEIPKFLRHVWAFDHLRLTGEDRRRTTLYQQEIRRERLHEKAAGFEGFLAALGLVVKITPLRAGQLMRAAQLTERTNQFNFTTIRRTETEIQELLGKTGAAVLTVEVEDRFGDYGLVGLMICWAAAARLEVDTFLLSCRVLGKGVEHRMLAHLGELASAGGCEWVDIKLSRTAKNGPAFDFISGVAGPHVQVDGDKCVCQLPATHAAAVKLDPKSGDHSRPALPETSSANMRPVQPATSVMLDTTRSNWIATEMNEAECIHRAIAENKRAKRPARLGVPVAPRDALEQQLVRSWETVLGVELVGIHDNFFELGGHSLAAVRLLSQVEKLTGKRLALVSLSKAPTIAEFAPLVRHHQASAASGMPQLRADPARANEPFPLTELQQAYVAGRSAGFDLANPLHLYFEFDPDHFDLERASSALRTLIARHSMLRAVVRDDGMQQILSRVPEYQIDLIDLRNHSPEKAAAILAAERERLSHQCFDLEAWPWFEVRAVRLDEHRFRLLISYDAVMLDAWSTYLLAREFATLLSEPEANLPALDVTFRDCVLAEIASRESESYRRARQYWTDRLAELPPSPALPLAQSPSGISRPRTVRHSMKLDYERWSQFKQHAARSGVTPGIALIGAYAEIVARWSPNRRFTLNLPIFNRPPLHPRINDVAGYFTSLSLLAVEPSQSGSFADHTRAMQQQLLNDLDHSAYNGVLVARDLARLRGANGRASAPIVTANIMLEDGFQSTVPGRVVFGLTQTPQVLLDQIVTVSDGALVVCWDAVGELFPGAMLDEMFGSFCDLLSRLAEDETLWSASGSPVHLPPGETARDPCAASDQMLHTLFLKQLAVRRDEPAVITPSRTLGYGELHRRASFIAQRLRESGVKPDSLVGIVMEKGWEQIVAALGILYSGAAYLPIEAGLPPERIKHLLRHGEVKIALTQPRHAARIDWPENVACVCVDEEGELDADFVASAQTCDDLAYVIYTSGSTGLPKGVMIDHRGAVNTILDINSRYRVTAGDRVFALSSLGFDLSVYDVFGPLAAGGTIVMPAADDALDTAHWAEVIVRHGVTIWNSVPALMKLFVEYAGSRPEMAGHKLRLALLSGDWIPLTLPEQIHALAPKAEVISLGGATEASIWSILFPIQRVDPCWKSIPYGRAMLNQSFHVLDKALDACPTWVIGELYIGGIGLAKGYWRNREKTEASFITHPRTGERMYRTGDLGRRLPDGNIEFLGREDFQVKIQGLRIELEEIETVLIQHPCLSAAVVAARGGRDGPKRLIAYVMSKEHAPSAGELRDFLLARLPDYMVPTAFVPLDALPLTPNGKIDRGALPEPDLIKPTETSVAARNESELKLTKIWEEVLGMRDIGVRDDFFELGGHSLLGMQILSRVWKTFDKKLPLVTIIQTRNIEKLSAVLHEAGTPSSWYAPIPILRRGSRPAPVGLPGRHL